MSTGLLEIIWQAQKALPCTKNGSYSVDVETRGIAGTCRL